MTDQVNALCAHLVSACDTYRALRVANTDAEIGRWVNSELLKFPDQDRVAEIFGVATRLERAAANEAKLAKIAAGISPMQQLIDRLLAEAPKLTDATGTPIPNQAPALECVVLFANGQAIRGSLSKTPEGTLRMMTPGQEDNRPVLVEQFFDYAAVSAIALTRDVAPAGSKILIPRGRVS